MFNDIKNMNSIIINIKFNLLHYIMFNDIKNMKSIIINIKCNLLYYKVT